MIRPIASTVKNKMTGISWPRIRLIPLVATDVGGGMVSSIYSPNLEDNQFQKLVNVRTLYGKLSRRPGLLLYTPAKPDNNPVLMFAALAKNDGSVKLLRLTQTGIAASSVSSWTGLTGTLHTAATDRYNVVLLDNRVFISNNGSDPIIEIDTTANTFAALGNAPNYKYITGFADRLIGANLAGNSPNPNQLGWSGNKNYAVWDSITDNTAGFQPITDSSSDLADYISGVFGFSNVLTILRERSVWEGTKTGSFSNPFNIYNKIPGIGCDSPYSVGRIPAGLTWLDTRTRNVYVLGLDGSITPIADPIKLDLLGSVNDPKQVFGSYNPHSQLYSICIPDKTSQVVRAWEFSFVNKTWSYDEYVNITSISDLDYIGSSLTIDDLVGTIDQLQGTIDSLSPSVTSVTRFYGYKTGELAYENDNTDTDWNGSYSTSIISKDYEIPVENQNLAEVRIEYIPKLTGNFLVQLSNDGGITWDNGWTVTYDSTKLGQKLLATFKVNRLCRLASYKITSLSGLVDIARHELRISQSGDATK